jgi:lipoic acid synthetase
MNNSTPSEKLKPKAQRLPQWMRRPISTDQSYTDVQRLLSGFNLNTVCASANCPNRHECWNSGTATFMILGAICTRNCRFCNVTPGTPEPEDIEEPNRVAMAADKLGLRHVVITSVTRDDLPDGGANAFANTIRAVKQRLPKATVEVLTPDFIDHLDIVLDAAPDVFNHNLETVQRIQQAVRPQASYERSLATLKKAAEWGGVQVKSGLMLGLGETDDEVFQTLEDLLKAGVKLLTLGQYLAPTREHHPVERFISPEHFDQLKQRAESMGFSGVAAGPLVRSSYHADELVEKKDV